MYEKIATRRSVPQQYEDKLVVHLQFYLLYSLLKRVLLTG